MNEIVVIGYPRSGNTWLTRLLGDLFQAPIRGLGNEKPAMSEARPLQDTIVYQTHTLALIPETMPAVHIWRDPRAVAVSMYHYWELASLDLAIDCLLHDDYPPVHLPAWETFNTQVSDRAALSVRYRDLHYTPKKTLRAIAALLGKNVAESDLNATLERQQFDNALQYAKPIYYAPALHQKSLRKGKIDDWRKYLDGSHLERLTPLVARYDGEKVNT